MIPSLILLKIFPIMLAFSKSRKQETPLIPFPFKSVTIEDICKEIRALDAPKATQRDDIPTKIIKNISDIFQIFQANFNNAIETSTFPEQLKCSDVKPIFKKDSGTDKKNYRPISSLPNVSKICERCINKQLEECFQELFAKYQCGFRKSYDVINALLPMIEKLRKSLDAGGAFGALLADLSKAFDCLPHELLIADLHAYRVDIPSLKLLYSYLTKRKQRVKLNGTCNINLNKVLHDLEKISNTLLKWFTDNLLKANPEKSHLTNSTQEIQINIGEIATSNRKCDKLLGIHFDNKLTFESHVRSLCKKASQKLNAFARIAYSLKFEH